jgi:hypothetical protein
MFAAFSGGRDSKVEEEIPQGGIGQAISRTIIEVHGGRLWATPNDGAAASFQLTLVLRKNSILIALDIVSPCSDNRQEQPPVPERETLVMIQFTRQPRSFILLAYTLLRLLGDALRFLGFCLRPNPTLAAENLFLR